MRRGVASFLAITGFSFLLVGTSKAPTGASTSTTSSPPVPSVSPESTASSPTSLAVPSTAGWIVRPVPTWKLHLSIPKDWTVPEYDDSFVISFNGTDAGEYSDCTFRKPPTTGAQYVLAAKSGMQSAAFLLVADDAIVAHTKHPAFGPSLEVAACGKAGTREFCCHMVAPRKASSQASRPATDEQGMQLVAVARSIKATP
jgi:hypothetical protein